MNKISLAFLGVAATISQLGMAYPCRHYDGVTQSGDLPKLAAGQETIISCPQGTQAYAGVLLRDGGYDFCLYERDTLRATKLYVGCFKDLSSSTSKTVQRLTRSDGNAGFLVTAGKSGQGHYLTIRAQ